MTSPSETREFVHTDDVRSGLKTDTHLERDPPFLGVAWIAWDSGFRGTGLRVGDHIVAVDGVPITRPAEQRDHQRTVPRLIGQYAEHQEWAAQGKGEGATVTLRIRRRAIPGDGWTTLDIAGTLRCARIWSVADTQRRLFGPGGPEQLGREDFDESWSSWYDKRLAEWERVLDGGWQSSLQTRMALKSHLEHRPRIDALVQRHPGPFADAMRADWELVEASLEGALVPLPADALDFRTRGEQEAKRFALLVADAWKAAQAARAAQILPAFPAIDPFRGDRAAVTGKLVVLPLVTPRDWLMDMGQAYLAWQQAGHWVFAPLAGPALGRIFTAVRRYERLVAPGVRNELTLIGRLLPDPRLLAGGGRTAAGLEVEAVAALVGGTVFVDAEVVVDGRSPFAGEDTIRAQPGGDIGDDATPRQVMEAMVNALKRADQAAWNGLFAEWRAVPDSDRPIWYPLYHWNGRDEEWTRSRRLLLDTVLDARVAWVGDVRTVIRGDEAPGLPRIEEVPVELDHIGSFDGETRVFNNISVHRQWTLQRRDGGPWRIASRQSL